MNRLLEPLLVGTRLEFDDVAWERCYDTLQPWKKRLFEHENLRAIGTFIAKTRKGVADELCSPKQGSFNVMLQMKFEDGGSAIIRFPLPGFSMFPEEKIKLEVEVIRFLECHTSGSSLYLNCPVMKAKETLGAQRLEMFIYSA